MMASPVVHGAVEFAVYGQVGAFVRPFCGERLIDVDAKSGRLPGMHQTIFKAVGVREDSVCLPCRIYSWMPKLWTLRSKWSAAGVDHRGANTVDKLFLDELLAIINRIEHFADGQRSCESASPQDQGLEVGVAGGGAVAESGVAATAAAEESVPREMICGGVGSVEASQPPPTASTSCTLATIC
jgi:hypothetical protein